MAKSTKVVRAPESPANAIRILKPPASAFNQHRPVSDLLWTQVENLAAVVKSEIDSRRRAVDTEGQASTFIQKMTEILHSLSDKDS